MIVYSITVEDALGCSYSDNIGNVVLGCTDQLLLIIIHQPLLTMVVVVASTN